jgi:hypothetical protein
MVNTSQMAPEVWLEAHVRGDLDVPCRFQEASKSVGVDHAVFYKKEAVHSLPISIRFASGNQTATQTGV